MGPNRNRYWPAGRAGLLCFRVGWHAHYCYESWAHRLSVTLRPISINWRRRSSICSARRIAPPPPSGDGRRRGGGSPPASKKRSLQPRRRNETSSTPGNARPHLHGDIAIQRCCIAFAASALVLHRPRPTPARRYASSDPYATPTSYERRCLTTRYVCHCLRIILLDPA